MLRWGRVDGTSDDGLEEADKRDGICEGTGREDRRGAEKEGSSEEEVGRVDGAVGGECEGR